MQESSARDRKRAQTYRRIHEAAVELVGRDGLASATVSDIAERAGVSRRTFFNYYPCKEDAVLGIQEPKIPPRALEAFVAPDSSANADGEERFRRALHLTVSTMASIGPHTTPAMLDIVAVHPELVDRLRAQRDATQELLVTALSERLAEESGSLRAADSARALILLSGAVLRFARGSNPTFLDNPDPAAIAAAMTAFRTALKEI